MSTRGPADAEVDSASNPTAAPLRSRSALREQVLKEDALEALYRDRTTLRLRHENGALERADDEACELLYVGIGGELARIDRCFQAVGYGCLVLREHRRDTSANRVALFARFRAEVSVQTSSTHVLLPKVVELPVDPRAQPTKWRQPVVPQRRADSSARHLSVALEDLESKCFLRGEMVREGPLRDTGSLDDVAHAGRPEPALVHQPQPIGEQLFLVRWT